MAFKILSGWSVCVVICLERGADLDIVQLMTGRACCLLLSPIFSHETWHNLEYSSRKWPLYQKLNIRLQSYHDLHSLYLSRIGSQIVMLPMTLGDL